MVYYLNENILKDTPYVANKLCSSRISEDKVLLTTDHGDWVVLSENEYELLLKNKLDENSNLFEILENMGIIITGRNHNSLIKKYADKFGYLFNGINLHVIAPTLRCNHKCLYCHSNSRNVSENDFDMDENTAKSLVDFIFQSPSKFLNIEFQGGEPLLSFSIVQFIIEYVKKKNNSDNCNSEGWFNGNKNISFIIATNLSLMDNDILQYLISNRVRISTSLDGPKELHDRNRSLRNGGSSYENVVYWINEINKKKYRLNALPTITKYSLNYAKEIVDEYIKLGFNYTKMRELNIGGMAINSWDEIGYTPEEFINFWKEYLDYIIFLNKKGVNFSDDIINSILSRILNKKCQLNACLNSPCGIGTMQCAYNHNGDIYTCDEARSNDMFKIGNVNESNYAKVFTSDNVANLIRLSSCTSFQCDSCVWHAFCSPCLVSTYGESKSLIPKFPNFICKIRGEQTKEIFKKIILPNEKDLILKLLKRI